MMSAIWLLSSRNTVHLLTFRTPQPQHQESITITENNAWIPHPQELGQKGDYICPVFHIFKQKSPYPTTSEDI
jgi:hypothetical protein